MKSNPRMESLFRATTEFLLIMTAVSLAAANPPSNTHSAAVSDKNETKRIAEPGGGQIATITLKESDCTVEVGGRQFRLEEFLRSAGPTEGVVLRLNGPQWQQLTALVRSRDLRFTVESGAP
jgi:hypothetical protein